jgi:DNA-damage-inducible protein D
MLGKRGIKPEKLPPAEDIKKLERRVLSRQQQSSKNNSKQTN